MTLKLTLLGTSSAIPTKKRNHPAVLLKYDKENILFDCGEGTQRQFRKAKLNPCKITKLIISHWHGDHVLGIPGLLQTLSLSGYNKTLHIYGPKGTKKYIKEMLKAFRYTKNKGNKEYIKVIEISKSKFLETDDFYIKAKKLSHGIPCNAYTFVKKGKIKIKKSKLKKYKIPSSPKLAKLKKGKNIKHNGKTHKAKDLTYKEKDKKVSFISDTKFLKTIIPFVKNSDILISESTYSNENKDLAKEHKHLTSTQAAKIAKKSKSKKLILTHLSQRYSKNPKQILKEAKKVFKNTQLAKDLDVIEVK